MRSPEAFQVAKEIRDAELEAMQEESKNDTAPSAADAEKVTGTDTGVEDGKT